MIDYDILITTIADGVLQGGLLLMFFRSLIYFTSKLITKLLTLHKLKKFQKNLNKIRKEGNNSIDELSL